MGDALCIPAGISACVTGPQRSCSGDDTLSPNPPCGLRQTGYKPAGDPALSCRSGTDAVFCGQSVPLPLLLAACLQRLLAEASGSKSGHWADSPKAPGHHRARLG